MQLGPLPQLAAAMRDEFVDSMGEERFVVHTYDADIVVGVEPTNGQTQRTERSEDPGTVHSFNDDDALDNSLFQTSIPTHREPGSNHDVAMNLGVACVWALSNTSGAGVAIQATGVYRALAWIVKYRVQGWERPQHMSLCALWTATMQSTAALATTAVTDVPTSCVSLATIGDMAPETRLVAAQLYVPWQLRASPSLILLLQLPVSSENAPRLACCAPYFIEQ